MLLIVVGGVIVAVLALAALYDHRARRRGWRVGFLRMRRLRTVPMWRRQTWNHSSTMTATTEPRTVVGP